MKRKFIAFVGMSSLVVSGLFGLGSCGGKTDVVFLNFKPEVDENYRKIAAAYNETHADSAYNIVVSTAAQGQYDTTLKSMMGRRDAPTLFQTNGPVGFAKWKDYCADLTSTKLYTELSDQSLALKDGGKAYGVPITVEGYGIIYNKSLTDKYFALETRSTATGANSMDDIKSFETLNKVVADMQTLKGSIGVDGVFSATSMKEGEQWRWQTHLFNLPLTGEIGYPASTPKEFKFTYKDQYKALFDMYIDNSTKDLNQLANVDTNASMAEFAGGKSMMVQNGNWGTSQVVGVEGSKVKSEDLKFLPIYSGIKSANLDESKQGLAIGTENYLCVNKDVDEKQQKAAIDFAEWLFTGEGKDHVTKSAAEASGEKTDGLGFIPTYKGYTDANSPSDPLSKEVMNWMSKTGIVSTPWAFNLIPSEGVKNTLGADLLAYVNANKEQAKWDTAVTDTIAKWKSDAAAL